MSLINNQIQKSSHTAYDRYPTIFKNIKDLALKNNINNISVLSFGCSTGEELFCLNDMYLTNAKMFGVDIQQACIDIANQKKHTLKINNIHFYTEFNEIKNLNLKFNFVLALSCLCIWPDSASKEYIGNVYQFEEFEQQCAILSDAVKLGGYFVIHNSNYFFEQTKIFDKYIIENDQINVGEVKKFDKTGYQSSIEKCGTIFKKIV